MYNDCIENFLNKTHPSSAERHSDSSDFEIPSKYFRVAAKIAIHTSQLRNESSKLMKEHTKLCNAYVNTQHIIDSETSLVSNMNSGKRRNKMQHQMEENRDDNNLSLYNREATTNHYIKRSHGNIDIIGDLNINQDYKPRKLMSSSTDTEDLNTSNSNNKSSNCTNSNSIDKFKICVSQADSKPVNVERRKYDKLFWHPKKLKKVGNDNESYTIRPIYVIERKEYNPKNEISNKKMYSSEDAPVNSSSCSTISFADSEKEIFKRSYRILSSAVSKQNDLQNKSMENKSNASGSKGSSIKTPQYPLKANASTPCHTMSPIYESKSVATDLKVSNKLTSSSSAFWNFLSDKVHRKYSKRKDRKKYPCEAYNIMSCHQDMFENTQSAAKKQNLKTDVPQDVNHAHEINQTEFLKNDTHCQCSHGSTKLEILKDFKQFEIKQSNEVKKSTSHRRHDAISKALAEKYNGEILCIHNPPCVLINGCLNMCSSKSGNSEFWPVMAKRNVSFGHKSRKAKKSKSKNKNDQCSQYQPSVSKLEECLPEFKVDVQNKRSPCQVFQCQGARGLKLDNSPRMPELASLNLLKGVTSNPEQSSNCAKIPVCSKVYVVVNSNENNNAKAVCPHRPPCLMIPKCLAKLISNNYVRVKSVPDCTHVPYCEKIPACYGQALKDARSAHSKSPCHIV